MRSFQLVKINAETPYERGLQYGEQAKEKIKAGIDSYKEFFLQTSGMKWEQVISRAKAYIPLVNEVMPEVLLEAKGIAKGASVHIDDIMVLNCRYEITKIPVEKECTTCVVLPEAAYEGKMLLVKNWDYRAGILDNIIILHIEEPNGTRIIGLTEAGQLIREGFNSYGVGLCNNSLQSIYDSNEIGIPVTFLRRSVLRCKTFEEAREMLLTAKRNVSTNMLLATKDGKAVNIEAFPTGYNLIEPTDGIITHANHFVKNSEINALDSSPRDKRLNQLLRERHGNITIKYIKECMCDHENYPKAICRHPSDVSVPITRRSITVASMIVDFNSKVMHVCAGPPCEGDFIEYKL